MSDPVRSHRDRTSPPLPASPTSSFLRRLAGQLLDAKPTDPAASEETEITQRRIDRAHGVLPQSVSDFERTTGAKPTATPAARPLDEGATAAQAPRFTRREEEVLR